jgi:ankyrin repeat protein
MKRISAFFLVLVLSGAAAAAANDAPLADAAEKMDRARVEALLGKRVPVDVAQADGMTALMWAVYHDDAAMAGALVRAGASVKAANR